MNIIQNFTPNTYEPEIFLKNSIKLVLIQKRDSSFFSPNFTTVIILDRRLPCWCKRQKNCFCQNVWIQNGNVY